MHLEMEDDAKLEFVAEIKRTASMKTASLDKEYTVVLMSGDPTVMALGMFPPDTLVRVTIEVENG